MRAFLIVVSLFALYSSISGLRVHNSGKHVKKDENVKSVIPPFKTFYMEQYLDHFNLKDDRTFQMRYLLNGKTSLFAVH